ncbi:hypothetical protein [Thioalkalivibrio sp. AKL10]|uniref:hypothetical protein n=1 Tax=Thioalkalivibrio sp. AKL10 TaxID=1158158 RepID=UPI0012DF67B1|nr:hypothetical protein [Thioalkalivibrio sp. AKL10]
MAINLHGYFEHLRSYLADDYIVDCGEGGTLTIKEKYYPEGSGSPKIMKIQFSFTGEAFAINLDKKVKKSKGKGECSQALFAFLDDNGKPWSKKCDYVIFHRLPRHIYVYCIELKSKGINVDTISGQLNAGVSWVKSLKKIIETYSGHRKQIKVQKFVFSSNRNPVAYLGPEGKYLARDPSVRFYHYDDVKGVALEEFENSSVDTV